MASPNESSLLSAFRSRRTLAVTLLSFSSGLPLGLIWIAVPDWMRAAGVDIRVVGLMTLAQAPWTFKLLWAPLMDRYPLPWLGPRRGWIAATQILLFALILMFAGLGSDPQLPWVILAFAMAIAIGSASHDIVIDAYAVDVLRPEEQAVAVGARTALYRVAMFVAGSLAITLTGAISWPATCVLLGVLYVPLVGLTLWSPSSERTVTPTSFRDAVWLPLLGVLGQPRALSLLSFVLLYKLCDNLSQSLLRPFLVDVGFSETVRGFGLGTIGFAGTMIGTFAGGLATNSLGLSRSLWVFGILQIGSNLGYIWLTYTGPVAAWMYVAMGFEHVTTGLGMGAFGVLLLRMTQKQFSATQYALFSSLFALPRILAGPLTGYLVYGLGWRTFFWITMIAGIPGMVLLGRILPWGAQEPAWGLAKVDASAGAQATRAASPRLTGIVGAFGTGLLALLTLASMRWLTVLGQGEAGSWTESWVSLFRLESVSDGLSWLAVLTFAVVGGLFCAAYVVARRR